MSTWVEAAGVALDDAADLLMMTLLITGVVFWAGDTEAPGNCKPLKMFMMFPLRIHRVIFNGRFWQNFRNTVKNGAHQYDMRHFYQASLVLNCHRVLNVVG
ncbi:hypothetical protein AGMMS50225_16030 [Betaproteobacteria bacterium]|nr:hypothetical protein AGMMS50225_16030 [Betaproteobacteria bacterium]